MKTKILLWCVSIFVVVGGVGCEVTSEKIQTWKQSMKGAAKIRAAIRDTGQKLAIRVEAASAMGELGLFLPLVEDLKALDEKDRIKLMESLVGSLVSKMEGSNPTSTSKVQIQAKDTLFSVREVAELPLQRTIDDKVVRWLVGDWGSRSSGEHSSEKIVTSIGEPAGPALAETIGVGGTPAVVSATLLRKIGKEGIRDKAAENLVAVAMKEKPPKVQTFHALGKVGSVKAVAYLNQVAVKGSFEQRTWALRALALFPHPGVIETMKGIAGDTTLKDDQALLRDEAFSVMEKIDDPKSLDALCTFLADSDEKVRYRAAEAITSGFKAKGLSKLLEGLPSRYTYKKEDLVDFLEKDISELGASALPALRSALESKSWVAKVIAVRVLGIVGTKQDIGRLDKLTGNGTRLKGWEGGATIGTEAKAAIKLIQNRK
jgi:HEAT repeats